MIRIFESELLRMVVLKYLFSFIVLLHGLIHLIGFAKAFQYVNIAQLTKEISKPVGVIWLLAAMLFISASVAYIIGKPAWFLYGIAAVALSQIVIVMVWSDAKFGTIANAVILVVALPALGHYRFLGSTRAEARELLSGIRHKSSIVKTEGIDHLPPVVQRWLSRSGVIGKEQAYCARIRQSGRMRTTPESKWMNFTAEQYVDLENLAFVWTTRVSMMPLIYLEGRDKFQNGKGEMMIKLMSLVNIVNEGSHEKINTGSMLRYLGELCWFPSAALHPYIHWEEMDSLSALATMTYEEIRVSGVFRFTESGDMVSFEAERYYGGGEEATLEKWLVRTEGYRIFEDIKVPNKSSVIWQLKDGDFVWLELEIIDLEINNSGLY